MNRWEDIIEVQLPLPFALKIINAFLIKGKNGYTIIDTGLHIQEDVDKWEEVQSQLGFKWDEVEKIVLTHYHPDHYGLAGTLQAWTGAPVYLSETDYKHAQLFLSDNGDMPEAMASFFSRHGLEVEFVEKIPAHLRSYHRFAEPHPSPSFIKAGDTIYLGDYEYQILHTPGHADGHLSFYDPARKWLIGGDFLLPRISPNISLWPRCDPNPLETYLSTLRQMKEIPVQTVFPSHGKVFHHYEKRIDTLLVHHKHRLEEMKKVLLRTKATTAYEICKQVFGEKLSIHNLRFALSEVLAHLEYLRVQGEIQSITKDGKVLYRIDC
ncbi:MBL fold metallo-hydrolase [Hazenella sp. IB182357]|uniref:MBL fold metallo-hydrolase n=1 Tax=Polycladospora coralii TaxID=2771432 RepID=A0A926NCG4_9BACL|nr:MBL fold metallo-hydrolase [Polycladospora coralii]MBD1370878.1 MBL fold metallo-hydrolase [Polycladospora coralii]MBS7529817.1 MBL fold metallo-hydrolase [Polycladospora coralii]